MINIDIFPAIAPALNVADIDVIEGAAGPGRRLTIWLQGCLKRCPGCGNGPFLPLQRECVLSVEELLSTVDHAEGIEGVTLSGGEPILQARSLIPFLEEVRRRGLSVVCYTGYTINELLSKGADPALPRFLEHVDWLIDGEYRRDLSRAGPYRPSANQRLLVLTNRLVSSGQSPETVFRFGGGQCVITGTLPLELRRRLSSRLRSRGILLKV